MNTKNPINMSIISIPFTLLIGLLIGLFFSLGINKTIGATSEVGTLIEYKDTFLKGNTSAINVLTDIISLTPASNKNQDILYNASDVTLNVNNNPLQSFTLLSDTESQIDAANPYFQANQNAPKNPTIFAPFSFLGDNKNIQQGVPLFFISYFEDGNSSQEGGYTSFKVVSSTGSVVNKFYIGQAKIGSSFQIPAKNQTYTYGFYQTQNKSNLFLSGGNLNMNNSGITGISTSSGLTVGSYKVYIQNINKFGFKSDELLAGDLNIIPSSAGGTIIQAGKSGSYKNYSDYLTDPTKFWFPYSDNIDLIVNLGGAASAEYVNNSILDTNTGAVNGANWKFSNIKLVEGNNFVIVNFKDSSNKTINSIPLVLNIDTKAPIIYKLTINDTDYINKKTFDNETNMVKYNGIMQINDKLSQDGVENKLNTIPVYIEYMDDNLTGLGLFYGSTEGTVTTPVTAFTSSGYINGKRRAKFDIPEVSLTDILQRTYFGVGDIFGNNSNPIALNYEINRKVNDPIVVTNGGNNFSIKGDKIDLIFKVDKDVNRIIFNGRIFSTSGNTEIKLFGVPLVEGENILVISAKDVLDNSSGDTTFKIIRNPSLSEGLAGVDSTLNINGNVNAENINFNRITNDGSAGEVIQGNN